VRLRSLAKVNLDLRVLYKRTDGFHELRTVFQTISLADTLEIEYQPARRTVLEIDDPLDIPDNLVLRAARATLDAMKLNAQVRFRLRKSIPMGGGLGGGSSNAAAVLLGLPVLARAPLPADVLMRLSAELGSDVPFFLRGGTTLALGRGTELYSLPDVASEPILVVAPGIYMATGAAYQALAREVITGTGQGLTSPDLLRKINSFQLFVRTLGDLRSARAASALSANDFESAVFSQHPPLKKMWGRLRKHAAGARMTGSGSALFAIFASKAERDFAEKVLEGDRAMRGCRMMPATLVSASGYRRLWRRQLAEYLENGAAPHELLWPLPNRHGQ
ncbi:MAG: 4-(cytidine 5'-diphospho)-2-C-methyl-D-erythritol kinase, partial [Candidatus Binataceae bacterium]